MSKAIEIFNWTYEISRLSIMDVRALCVDSNKSETLASITDLRLPDESDVAVNFLCVEFQHPICAEFANRGIGPEEATDIGIIEQTMDLGLTQVAGPPLRVRMAVGKRR